MKLNRMSLRSKITWLVSLNLLLVLGMVLAAVSYQVVEGTFEETGARALAVARTVAGLPQVVSAFGDPDPSRTIQPLAESVRRATGAEFVVVSNLKLIRYSHPNPAEIGRHMVGEDNTLVLQGRESITRATGTLGDSVRGKAPVFDARHRQIGVVSTGFLVQHVRGATSALLWKLLLLSLIALAVGLAGSYLLSGHVKRQILDMEPHEIAFTVQEQAAVLEAIHEGIIAVNAEGEIVTCNREAKELLGRESEELVGARIADLIPNTRLPEVLRGGGPQLDQPMVLGNQLVVASRVPVLLNGRVIGAVSTFRDKVALDQIDLRLADIGRYLDTLRSQRHEFMNKLHLISGLIRMSEYESAAAVIDRVNEEYQETLSFYLARIKDPAIVGILVGKAHRADELGVKLRICEESLVSAPWPHREVVLTALGNAIDNAFEALGSTGEPAVSVLLGEGAEELVIEVRDNGPGVAPAVREHLFEEGVSTKGEGRGLGLALVQRLVAHCGGRIDCTSSSEGTLVRVSLPRTGRE